MHYAVFDVETTGVYNSDRIIELGIVLLDARGQRVREFESLINPGRDVGPTHIHGLEASDLVDAPTFEEILGDVLELLNGNVFVAHNATFDSRFIRNEFQKSGMRVPGFPTLCTMHSAKKLAPGAPGHCLDGLCRVYGIERSAPHSALCDARTTAELLLCYFKQADSLDQLWLKGQISPEDWPIISPSGKYLSRKAANVPDRKKPGYLSRLVAKLPLSPMTTRTEVDDYLYLLDRVLEDRVVDEDEFEELSLLAEEMNLTQADVKVAHRTYLRDLYKVAMEDGILTAEEIQDLLAVRSLLDITEAEYAALAGGDLLPELHLLNASEAE